MNEPVAWMYEKPNGASKLSFVKEKMLWEDMTETPLYTHPAKTLTDEEIAEIIQHLKNAKYVGASKAATMLRQQQAEIKDLKSELKLIDELVTGKAQEK